MNKVALISNGSSQIGKSTIELLCRNGYSVIFSGNKKEELLSLEKELISNNLKAVYINADLKKENEITKLVSESLKTFGKIDVLIHIINFYPFNSENISHIDDFFSENIRSFFLLIKEILPYFQHSKSGDIIIVNPYFLNGINLSSSLCLSNSKALDSFISPFKEEINKSCIRLTNIYIEPIINLKDSDFMELNYNPVPVAKSILFAIELERNSYIENLYIKLIQSSV